MRPDDDSVTEWCVRLQQGDDEAATRLWQHFSSRLLSYARSRLRAETQRVYDEEDLAASAFRSLCRGITSHRIENLAGRDNFWRLLLTIASRKISARHRYDNQQMRDRRRTMPAGTASDAARRSVVDLNQFPSRDVAPDLAVELAETCSALFLGLADPSLQQIVERKLEGFNQAEIADQLGLSRRTVVRRLERIRQRWMSLLDTSDAAAQALPKSGA